MENIYSRCIYLTHTHAQDWEQPSVYWSVNHRKSYISKHNYTHEKYAATEVRNVFWAPAHIIHFDWENRLSQTNRKRTERKDLQTIDHYHSFSQIKSQRPAINKTDLQIQVLERPVNTVYIYIHVCIYINQYRKQ